MATTRAAGNRLAPPPPPPPPAAAAMDTSREASPPAATVPPAATGGSPAPPPAPAAASKDAPGAPDGSENDEHHNEHHDVHPPAPTPAQEAAHHDAGASADLPEDASHATPGQVFDLPFMRLALIAGLLVGGVCAYLGLYVVLRRMVFLGVALSQMSSAGVALALLTGASPLLGSTGLMLVGVALLSYPWASRKIRQDAFTGVGYAVASAVGILLLAKSPKGEGHLLDLLYGQILLVSAHDVWLTAWVLAGVMLLHVLFAKEFLFVSFDPDSASASGYATRIWESLLYLSVGLVIALAIHAVGILLTFASLILPAVTALLVTRRWRSAVPASLVAGLVPVPLGLYLSFVWDLPAVATIVALGFVLLVAGGVVSRFRA